MSWLLVDDNYNDRPDVAALSPFAYSTLMKARTWAAKEKTDGRIPTAQAYGFAACGAPYGTQPAEVLAELTSSSAPGFEPLWETREDDPGAFWIRGHLEGNRSKAEQDERKRRLTEQRRAAGKARARKAKRDPVTKAFLSSSPAKTPAAPLERGPAKPSEDPSGSAGSSKGGEAPLLPGMEPGDPANPAGRASGGPSGTSGGPSPPTPLGGGEREGSLDPPPALVAFDLVAFRSLLEPLEGSKVPEGKLGVLVDALVLAWPHLDRVVIASGVRSWPQVHSDADLARTLRLAVESKISEGGPDALAGIDRPMAYVGARLRSAHFNGRRKRMRGFGPEGMDGGGRLSGLDAWERGGRS